MLGPNTEVQVGRKNAEIWVEKDFPSWIITQGTPVKRMSRLIKEKHTNRSKVP